MGGALGDAERESDHELTTVVEFVLARRIPRQRAALGVAIQVEVDSRRELLELMVLSVVDAKEDYPHASSAMQKRRRR